ncbi:cytochrome P450 [Rhizobium halophytocola]|uniref:Cytochrome P450 n=1 Tax=Rhizobium halophytocola TaxID=735519 RepID=A0ABS4E1I5_9HYPH|nr:cytochrome P450 [Rhizobium halophytocola]MBP1851805.1 cytochrome P450 [Rhizobium halophytocola]
MDLAIPPFEPPAPIPRTVPPGRLEVIRTVFRNPLELWGEASYTLPWIDTRFFGRRSLIVNHPGLIRHLLVDNASNYKMQNVRQLVLRPILRDGLLTAEGLVWKRTRKAIAPVFTPRHAKGFATQMYAKSIDFVEESYFGADATGLPRDISVDMAQMTFAILSETLFSGEIAVSEETFSRDTENLLHFMGRIDPMDLMEAPSWVPRVTRIGGGPVMAKFRDIVKNTIDMRRRRVAADPANAPQDFLTLMLALIDTDSGLTEDELQDNILTFIGAGHETTARALAWTLYCVANTPSVREAMEDEIDRVLAEAVDPVDWLESMPHVRAAFEEAMRLYPPAPSINRQAVKADSWTSPEGEVVEIPAGVTVLIMPWTLHRHELLWEEPRLFRPERFLPENRGKIDRFQYLPFGAGPRVCIGATFALQEAVIALGVLMHRYRFDPLPGFRPWPVQRLTVQPIKGMPMRVTPRAAKQAL